MILNWFPQLELGFMNGWVFFLIYLIIFGITVWRCPPAVRKRLYDRSLWTRKTKMITAFGKFFSLLNIVMIIFGVLVIGNLEFLLGTFLYLVGLSLLVIAIIHYRNAPLDQPIVTGVYMYSRNPQIMGIFIMFFGMVLVIGSWLNIIFLSISLACTHFSILGEEYSLEQQYGESYLNFKKKIPRYI
jgi:protein-S-isoprenylcysteine O-methyltransferase Ste14